jgi:hypothetical protein
MLANVLIILYLIHHHAIVSNIISEEEDTKELGIRKSLLDIFIIYSYFIFKDLNKQLNMLLKKSIILLLVHIYLFFDRIIIYFSYSLSTGKFFL